VFVPERGATARPSITTRAVCDAGRFCPEIISISPALTGFGEIVLTTAAALKTLNPENDTVLLPDVTVILAGPAAIFGTIANIEVAEAVVTWAATPPNVKDACGPPRFDPVMVTWSPRLA
jgi:hypothetical protein